MNHNPKRNHSLAEVFADTLSYIEGNRTLNKAQNKSIAETVLYQADEEIILPAEEHSEPAKIFLSEARTFETAMRLQKENPGKKIAVLNFASAVNPGGGVILGASAQEECLCRCSTLYGTLDQEDLWNRYYLVNRRAMDPLYTDACIYSPGILICKTDEALPERLKEEEFVSVDVITCAAPKLGREYHSGSDPALDEKLSAVYRSRIRRILEIAAFRKAEILVLGAFGCGAFHNDPDLVSKAFDEVLKEYLNRFELVEFAVYCRDSETRNYRAFRRNLSTASELIAV